MTPKTNVIPLTPAGPGAITPEIRAELQNLEFSAAAWSGPGGTFFAARPRNAGEGDRHLIYEVAGNRLRAVAGRWDAGAAEKLSRGFALEGPPITRGDQERWHRIVDRARRQIIEAARQMRETGAGGEEIRHTLTQIIADEVKG